MPYENDVEAPGRREFLTGGAALAGLLLGGTAVEVRAQAPPAAGAPAGPPVNFAVIGLGVHGRELLGSLSRVPGVNVVGVCDRYAPFLSRAKEAAPRAATVADYRLLLQRSDVHAVCIATPTHQHKEIALAALQAGKHVYCESPLAHTVEDARAIALAAKGAKTLFQAGQQYRGNPQHHHVLKFIRTGVLKNIACGRGQWHRKTSWRRAAPTPERERELNWRLDPAVSLGLVGEVGVHTLDVASWFLKALPVSVTGFGSLIHWKEDGRRIPDTIQVVLEYPEGIRFYYDASLVNSFDSKYEVFFGSDAAVLLREERAWMFKEADSPLLGWEVYARKEEVGDETGIALVADATKQIKEGKLPGKEKQVLDPTKTPLYFSLESFVSCIRENKQPDCGPVEGYQAAVTAIKANEAILKGTKIEYQKEWFALG